jgi:hypothetical protein
MARIIRLVQLAVLCTLLAFASAESILVDIGLVQHFLGNDTTPGSASGAGPNALLKGPSGCAVGSNGMFYFCDTLNRVVRRTLMGSAQADIWLGALNVPQDKPGQGTAARVTAPWSFKIMPDETKAYLMDFREPQDLRSGADKRVMQNWAGTGLPGNNDGTGGSAQFNGPVDMTFHRSTLDMYITESLGHRIRKATQTSVITLFCGSADERGRHGERSRLPGAFRCAAGHRAVPDEESHVRCGLEQQGDPHGGAGFSSGRSHRWQRIDGPR